MVTTTSATSSSSLDVAGIVSQLMTIEQKPLTALATKEASFQAKLSAYGTIKGALSTFQGSLSGLSSISSFQSISATSSDTTSVSATATSKAAMGSFTLDVTKLAQGQQLVAAGQASNTTAIGSGVSTTLSFDFGTIDTSATNSHGGGSFSNGVYTNADFTSNGSGVKTVTIDSTNNSLQGISDAINKANIGVTASIVNDGGTSPYRLTLASSNIGKTNSLKISVAGDATLSTMLSQDPANNTGQKFSETTTAQNAEFKVNGIAVSKPTNSPADVIPGVTLSLLKPTTSTVTVAVARNIAAINSSAASFVKAYNSLLQTLKTSSAYDPATKKGAVLQGDATVRLLQTQMHAMMNTPVGNTGGSITTLAQVGITFQKDGTLAMDSAKLNTALSTNFNDIAALFAATGKATDSLVTYNAASSTSKPGTYGLNISTVAAQASIAGNVNLNTINGTGLTDIAASTTVGVTLDGKTSSVALTAGSYTATQLATMIQSAINGTSAFSGATVAASIDSSGFMHITSNLYGSPSVVSMSNGTGTSAASFMGTVTSTAGADVAGSIGSGAAQGSGQTLTGTTGDATGLQVQVNGGAAGSRGTVYYSQGYAYSLNQLTTSMLATGGMLDSVTTGINSSITTIGKQRTALTARLATTQANYTKQFSALDSMLQSMNSTSNFLTQQLANLPKSN